MGSISKKTRFDVFKRDSFKCSYCGRMPPAVVLEVDHIIPKCKGGVDDKDNLVTACFDCNRGKSGTTLENIPDSLSINLKAMKEKELQIKEYKKFINIKNRRQNKEIKKISDIYDKEFVGYTMTENFKKRSLKIFIKKLPINIVEDAMETACSRELNPHSTLKYFCGICWRIIKEERLNSSESR